MSEQLMKHAVVKLNGNPLIAQITIRLRSRLLTVQSSTLMQAAREGSRKIGQIDLQSAFGDAENRKLGEPSRTRE